MGFEGTQKVQDVLKKALLGEWDEVVKEFSSHETIEEHKKFADCTSETALHVAVANGQTETVKKILDQLHQYYKKDGSGAASASVTMILKKKNKMGNTALHLAAAGGKKLIKICRSIITTHNNNLPHNKELFDVMNNKGETPLFLAAQRGNESSFFYLEYACRKTRSTQEILPLLKNDQTGDTILHSAINARNYEFVVRFLKMEEYEDLGCSINKEGLSALHLLALQPDLFKSSTVKLDCFNSIIYKGIFFITLPDEEIQNLGDDDSKTPPYNYNTCYDIYNVLKKFYNFARGIIKPRTMDCGNDEENVKGKNPCPSKTICFVVQKLIIYTIFIPFFLFGYWRINEMVKMKWEHQQVEKIMRKLIELTSLKQYKDTEEFHRLKKIPEVYEGEKDEEQSSDPCRRKETPFLTAARFGICEMVRDLLRKFPNIIEEKDCDEKNAVLLATENCHKQVYELFLRRPMVKETVFSQVDKDKNSALHLASQWNNKRPWFTSLAVLQMKLEIGWQEFVRDSMPPNFFNLRNKKGQTAFDIFEKTHKQLVKEAKDWVKDTCGAYSVVSTLISTVAFATTSNIPGSFEDGKPVLEKEFAFQVFAIASLLSLCTSMTATVFFLAILTAPCSHEEFGSKLPFRLQCGLTFLFLSIASILISFGSGSYFNVKNQLDYAAYPIFGIMCLPGTIYALGQVNLFLDLNRARFYTKESE